MVVLWVLAAMAASPVALHGAGDSDAWAGTVSLPIPREQAEALYGEGASPRYFVGESEAGAVPVAWWKRNAVPRRVMVYVNGDRPLGGSPAVRVEAGGGGGDGGSPWTVTDRAYKKNKGTSYKVILRGGSHADSFSEWDDLVLRYKEREFTLRMGTRRARFFGSRAFQDVHDWWQWTRVETLYDSPQIKLVRAGALLYNEDSFLQCDVYLELFGNGVARAYAHFVNCRVIGDGWEYFGIPVVAFGPSEGAPVEATLDGTQSAFDLGGGVKLDITDSTDLTGKEHPGRIYRNEDLTVYQPWEDQRVTDQNATYGKPFVANIGDGMFLRGLARTVRFTVSLSDAPAKVGRMLAPNWLYAQSEDLWNGDYLPVQWRFAASSHEIADKIAQPDARYQGTFEGGYSGAASVGNGGSCMLYSAMAFGDLRHLDRGLAYAYAWADIMVDHVDWSVRQPFTGYYWKTPPYLLYNDLVRAYVETGDPYLKETAEHCANAYQGTLRSTWPARSMGRGTMPTLGQMLLYRYLDEPYFARSAAEIVQRGLFTWSDPERLPGHAIGVGPNGIGNLNEPSGRGYADLVMVDTVIEVAEAEDDALPAAERRKMLEDAARVTRLAVDGIKTKVEDPGGWREFETALMIKTLLPLGRALDRPEMTQELEEWIKPVEEWLKGGTAGRPYDSVTGRPYYDSVTLNARWVEDGLTISPRWLPAAADGQTAVVSTPAGEVRLLMRREDGEWKIEPQGETTVAVRVLSE